MPAGRSEFREGFAAMLPLWLGAIPSGIAFGAAARGGGLNAIEAQAMSLTVFSAAAQMSTIAQDAAERSTLLVILTALALNAHLPLLGAAVSRSESPSWRQRLPLAWFLTDGAFAVAAARGKLTGAMVAGAGASMYLAWNAGTAAGLLAGEALPASWRSGIDLVVPLTFVAVLAPLLRSLRIVLVAAVAGATALVAAQALPVGVAVLLAGLLGAMLGAWRPA
jgi:predicted branched-subunit amino acid permease